MPPRQLARRDHRPRVLPPLSHPLAPRGSEFQQQVLTNLEDTRESSKTHDTEEEEKKRPWLQRSLPSPQKALTTDLGPKGQPT